MSHSLWNCAVWHIRPAKAQSAWLSTQSGQSVVRMNKLCANAQASLNLRWARISEARRYVFWRCSSGSLRHMTLGRTSLFVVYILYSIQWSCNGKNEGPVQTVHIEGPVQTAHAQSEQGLHCALMWYSYIFPWHGTSLLGHLLMF